MRDGVVAAFDRVCKSRPGAQLLISCGNVYSSSHRGGGRPGAQLLISCGNVYSSSHRGDGREHSYSFLAEMRTRIRIGRDGIVRDGIEAAFDRVCKSRPGAQVLISCGNVYASSHRKDGREHSYSFLAEMRTRIRIGRDGIVRDGVEAAFDRVCKRRSGAQLLISCGNVYSSSHRKDGREHRYSFLAEMRTRIRIGRDGFVRDGFVRDGFVRDGVEAAFDRVCKSRPGAQLLISCGNAYSNSHRKDGREHSYSFLGKMRTQLRILNTGSDSMFRTRLS